MYTNAITDKFSTKQVACHSDRDHFAEISRCKSRETAHRAISCHRLANTCIRLCRAMFRMGSQCTGMQNGRFNAEACGHVLGAVERNDTVSLNVSSTGFSGRFSGLVESAVAL